MRDLKALIREMALDAIGGIADLSKRTRGGARQKDPKGHFNALKKFHSSKKYARDAAWMFRNFESPIWIVPAWDKGITRAKDRVKIVPLQEALPGILESGIGLAPEEIAAGMIPGPENEALRIERINSHLAGNGTIIISASAGIGEGVWPSAWMLIHGLFDDYNNATQRQFLGPYMRRLEKWQETRSIEIENLFKAIIQEPQYAEFYNRSPNYWRNEGPRETSVTFNKIIKKLMTMRSAREGRLDASSDARAESFTQALTHSQGFHLNWDGIDETIVGSLKDYEPPDPRIIGRIKESLRELEELINGMRGEIYKSMEGFWRGKVVWANTQIVPYKSLQNFNRKKS
jgi:hypothetical protein